MFKKILTPQMCTAHLVEAGFKGEEAAERRNNSVSSHKMHPCHAPGLLEPYKLNDL